MNALTSLLRRFPCYNSKSAPDLHNGLLDIGFDDNGTQVMPVARIGGRAYGLNALLKSCGWGDRQQRRSLETGDHQRRVTSKKRRARRHPGNVVGDAPQILGFGEQWNPKDG